MHEQRNHPPDQIYAPASCSYGGCWVQSRRCAPGEGRQLGALDTTRGNGFCLGTAASLLHMGEEAGERRETFYHANGAKNKVDINLSIHALKGASFSQLCSDTKKQHLSSHR